MTEYQQHADPDEDTIGLVVIRQSKGTDDSMSLEQQREVVPDMIEDEVDEIELLDLGVHTGFSRHTRESDERHVEDNDDYMRALEAADNGRYDIIAGLDERRIARDEYIHQWRYAAERGDAEFIFRNSNPDDELTTGVKRVVEREAKKHEIKKSQEALSRRESKGYYHGPPVYGLRYDVDGNYLVPDGQDFNAAHRAVELVEDEDLSIRNTRKKLTEEFSDDVVPAISTITNIIDRSDWYRAVDDGAVIGIDGPVIPQK